MVGRTWRNVDNIKAKNIKEYLLKQGGTELNVKNNYEIWRIRFSDATFTYYSSGSLYSTPSESLDPAVTYAWGHIDSFIGSNYQPPTKDFLIGLDETGKGELIGHTILTGVFFSKEIFNELDHLIGPADTKRRHEFNYWDELFKEIDKYRKLGYFDFITEKISPSIVDVYNLNKIMDIVYQRILSTFFRKINSSKCRVVIDDYGVGLTLRRFLDFLKNNGAEIVISNKADNKYLEVKVASIISKRIREEVIKKINEDKEFQINNLSVGSGNAGDMQTMNWLKQWHASNKKWPWFVKRSFKPVREIEGRIDEVKKVIPPIKDDLLSKEFRDEFNKGNLSIQSLSLICPSCGEIIKAATFAIFEDEKEEKISGLKCTRCKKLISDAGITLRYYCGYVLPDTNIIIRGLISRDLESSSFFENFNIVISAVVEKECDKNKTGKKELSRLAEFASYGRIRLERTGKVEEIPDNLSSTQRDEMIIDAALKYNAILITADNRMKVSAISKNIFTIFI